MATYTQLALHLTALEAQSRRLAIQQTQAHFFPRLANHYRLFRRLRRRLHSTDQPILHTSHKLHALTVLRDLTKDTHILRRRPTSTLVQASTQTLKSTPFVAWPPASKNQDAVELFTSSTKP